MSDRRCIFLQDVLCAILKSLRLGRSWLVGDGAQHNHTGFHQLPQHLITARAAMHVRRKSTPFVLRSAAIVRASLHSAVLYAWAEYPG
jgi:hypothetical protein